MTTRIYFIRHGATELTAASRFSGNVGVELSAEGRHQVARLAVRLAGEPITAIYSSPLSRALDTARIVADPHRLVPIERDGLREITHGHWEGMTRAEVETNFPGEYETWEADPFTFAPTGAESGLAVLARALPVIRAIVGAHPGRGVAVVSHKATLRLLLSSLLGFEARGYRDRLDQLPACLDIVDFKDALRARLLLFNDTSHYQPMPPMATSNWSQWYEGGQHSG